MNMNKKLLGFLILTILVVVTIITVNLDKNSPTGIAFANVEALAADSRESDMTLWFRKDDDCVYTLTGKANSEFSVTIGGKLIEGRYNRNGEYVYRIKDGQTDCEAGGRHQCRARYCE